MKQELETISILLPTRNRLDMLKRTINSIAGQTRFIEGIFLNIYVDNDDTSTISLIKSGELKNIGFPINWIVTQPVGSMGEMFQEMIAKSPRADIYATMVDDYIIGTPGWDQILRKASSDFPDGIWLGYPTDPTAEFDQVTFAWLSSKWLQINGRYITNYFPYWFDDSWIDQVAEIVGRKVHLPIMMQPIGGKGKTPRMFNLWFWQQFYANTMNERISEAVQLSHAIHFNSRQEQVLHNEKAIDTINRLMVKYDHVTKEQCDLMEMTLCDDKSRSITRRNKNYILKESEAVLYLCDEHNVAIQNMNYEYARNVLHNIASSSLPVSPLMNIKCNLSLSESVCLVQHIINDVRNIRNKILDGITHEIMCTKPDYSLQNTIRGTINDEKGFFNTINTEPPNHIRARRQRVLGFDGVTKWNVNSFECIQKSPLDEVMNLRNTNSPADTGKLKLLLVYSLHPRFGKITLPEWIKDTLRIHYSNTIKVFACGPFNEIDIPDGPDFYERVADIVRRYSIDVLWDIEGGGVSIDFMFKRFPDLISIPKVYWAIDTHQFLPAQIEKSKHFDMVFSAQKDAVQSLGPHAHWLPAGAAMHERDYGLDRTIEVGFIGNIYPGVHDRRRRIIDYLQKTIPGFGVFDHVFLEEKARLASRMKIIVNISLKNDINFRVFETLACGALLITDKIHNNGLEDLFQDGEHLVTFDSEQDLVEKINYYLEHEDERIRIADAGKARVLAFYTHKAIVGKALDLIAALTGDRNKPSELAKPQGICWCGGKVGDSVHQLYYQCELCGTHVVRQKHSSEELRSFYTLSRYWHEHQTEVSGFPAIEDRAKMDFHDRIPYWFELIRKFCPNQRSLLEIGCAHGGFLYHCRQQGIRNVVGIEVDEETCRFARDHFKLPHVYSGLFPDVKLPMSSFDIITGFDVIEHFSDPIAGIGAITELLSDNGTFIFQTPCYRGEGKTWEQFRPLEHVFLYNESGIKKLFMKCGLEITDILPGYFPDDMFLVGHKAIQNKNIIFIRTDSIGDNILASSMLPDIRDKYPRGRMTVVCQAHIAELYEACPFVDAVIPFDKKRAYEDQEYRNSLMRYMQSLNADIALNSVYSREPLTDFFTITSGAEERIAFDGDLCNISPEIKDRHNQFYTVLLRSEDKHRPELTRHHDFLQGLGIDAPSLSPSLWLTDDDERFADQFFGHHKLEPDKTIALFAGAQAKVRVYSEYGVALSQICRKSQFTVVALGTAHEYEVNQTNLNDTGVRTINLCGRASLRQTAAILKRCRLAVGAETGTAHMACAVGTPNVVLLGGGHFGRFMPYSALTSVVSLPLPCFGCDWRCKYDYPHCVWDISPELISYAIEATLRERSEKARLFIEGHRLRTLQGLKESESPIALSGISSVDVIAFEDIPSAPHLGSAGKALPMGQCRLPDRKESLSEPVIASDVKDTNGRYPLSAIVSTYNSERFIRGCLEDLEAQTIADRVEIIVLDSGSEQNERGIVEEFQKRYDNIRYVRTEREPLYAAWNRAIKMACGKYITNANTDDRHRTDALEIQLRALQENPGIDLVYADCYMSYKPNETFQQNNKQSIIKYADFFAPDALLRCQFGPQPMWRKSVHDVLGYFDERYMAAGDYDFNIRFALHKRALHIQDKLGVYLKHDEALSFKDSTPVREAYEILQRYRSPENVIRLYRQEGLACSLSEERARAYLDMGNRVMTCYILMENMNLVPHLGFAIECFKEAMRLQPEWVAPYNNSAIALHFMGSGKEAAAFLKQANRIMPDPTLQYNMSLIDRACSQNLEATNLKLISSGITCQMNPFEAPRIEMHESRAAAWQSKCS